MILDSILVFAWIVITLGYATGWVKPTRLASTVHTGFITLTILLRAIGG